eukprot:COSAG01_NODE_34027_length_554_cov_15.312088_2_plen_21_part_01
MCPPISVRRLEQLLDLALQYV